MSHIEIPSTVPPKSLPKKVHDILLHEVRLQIIAFSDLDELLKLYQNAQVTRCVSDPPDTDKRLWQCIREWVESWQTFKLGIWSIRLRTNNKLIGWCGFHHRADMPKGLPNFELACVLAKDYWGHGLATQCTEAAIAYAFEMRKVEAVFGLASREDGAGRRVMQKLGMTRPHVPEFEPPGMVYGELRRTDYSWREVRWELVEKSGSAAGSPEARAAPRAKGRAPRATKSNKGKSPRGSKAQPAAPAVLPPTPIECDSAITQHAPGSGLPYKLKGIRSRIHQYHTIAVAIGGLTFAARFVLYRFGLEDAAQHWAWHVSEVSIVSWLLLVMLLHRGLLARDPYGWVPRMLRHMADTQSIERLRAAPVTRPRYIDGTSTEDLVASRFAARAFPMSRIWPRKRERLFPEWLEQRPQSMRWIQNTKGDALGYTCILPISDHVRSRIYRGALSWYNFHSNDIDPAGRPIVCLFVQAICIDRLYHRSIRTLNARWHRSSITLPSSSLQIPSFMTGSASPSWRKPHPGKLERFWVT